MNNPEIHFERPLLLLLLIPALAIVLIPWLRIPAARRSSQRKRAAVILRSLISVLLTLVLAGIQVIVPPEAAKAEIPDAADADSAMSVLVIADDAADAALLSASLPEDTAVVTAAPAEAPALLTYYTKVILNGTAATALPGGYGSMLSRYVQGGGTLLVTGGGHGLSLGGMIGTTYETLLPVTLDYTEESGEGISLMLVLDCSNSMTGMGGRGWGNTGGSSDNLANAKQGAIRSIEALTENDYAGLISFNSSATLRAELAAATDTQKAVLSRTISSLTTAQGTYYREALQMAWNQLKNAPTSLRHVIFLSDGEPTDSGYDTVVKSMAAEGITVSTIALGFSSTVLKNMAEKGGGRYYMVASVADLPDIMLSETEKVASDPLVEKTTAVALPGGLPAGLPDITGYIGTTLRDGAELLLQTENGDPLLVRQALGEGTVTVFTSDLTGEWTAAWLNSEAGKAELCQILQMDLTAPAAEPEAAAEESTAPRELELLVPLALAALLLMLADIAVRRLRWADIRMMFVKE